jgi:hypothetical protein
MAVEPTDIAVALGRPAASIGFEEEAQWEMWISDALMLISARLGDLSELDQTKLDYVVREAVISHVRKPDDATQVDIAVDDARSSRTYRTSKGRVTILDEWWNLLKPSDATVSAFSIRPSGNGYGSLHLPWCSLAFGELCSCGVNLAGFPIFELDGI